MTIPERGNCFSAECLARGVLSHLASRWGSLVIAALRQSGTLRFSQLRARIGGVSEKMLAQTLRELERDGLIDRKSYPVVPPRVEYSLTPLGTGVARHVKGLVEWIESHVGDVARSQIAHDAAVNDRAESSFRFAERA
jgi:DNA-binding HxlR family transcriptional regulator